CHDQGIRSHASPAQRTGSPLVPAARHQGRGAPCGESFWHWALGADGGHGHAQPPFRSSRLIGAERQPTSDCRQSLQQSPFSLIVRYNDASELPGTVARMEGQLTGTIQAENEDEQAARALIRALELKVCRILVGGWPSGVELGPAMVHGGPFPATTDSRTTSVGTLAIERFLRPVAYQTVPDKLPPPQLQDGNPWHLIRS